MKHKNDYIYIGNIVNTFGIKGELKVYSESDLVEERFGVNKTIFIKIGNTYEAHKVSSVRIHKTNVLITIDELYDINAIEKYVGAEIYADANDEIELNENEYYIDDLVGLDVYNTLGEHLGLINDVLEIPSGYLLEIKKEEQKILVPFVNAFVKEILEDRVIIEEIEGLRS